MRVITGDQTGLIKIINVEDKEVEYNLGEQDKENELIFLKFMDEAENELVSLNKKGQLNLYDLSLSIDKSIKNQSEQRLLQSIQLQAEQSIVGFYVDENKIYLTDKQSQMSSIEFNKEEDIFEVPKIIYKANQKDPVHFSRFSKIDKNLNLILSKEVNPQIIDVNQGKLIWKAKNVKNDWLDLKVPVWDVDGQFSETNIFYTATAHRKIRKYDTRQKNPQPVLDQEFNFENDKTPFTKLLISNCNQYLYASTIGGGIYMLDTRKNFQLVGKMKGAFGSVIDMDLHQNGNYLACVSLDRNVRVFDTSKSNNIIAKLHLKQKLSSVLVGKTDFEGDKEEFQLAMLEKNNSKQKIDGRENKIKFSNLPKNTVKLAFLKQKQENSINQLEDQKLDQQTEIKEYEQEKIEKKVKH